MSPTGDLAARLPLIDVVVVAAGSSRRMAGQDKLEARVGHRSLLSWSIASFADLAEVDRIVVVTAPDRAERLRLAGWLPDRVSAVVPGGARRQESVAAAIRHLGAEDGPGRDRSGRVVLVHDGARPVVTRELIRRVAAAAEAHGAAIPVVPIAETVKQIRGAFVEATVDRAALALAQTPQGLRRSLLEEAYRRFPAEGPETWTDEAALLEACTIPVHAVAGDPGNIKVTVPADLARVRAVLTGPEAPRIGLGQDSHPFGPSQPLVLGGVVLPGAPRLLGHSDGDVALHAIADALLGAAALGDLGRMFPADARTPRGVGSDELLRGVVDRLAAEGLRAVSVDLTIVGARPRFGARLDEMRSAIEALLGLRPGHVNVKASSGNLTGPEGAGRAISARAVAVVEPIR